MGRSKYNVNYDKNGRTYNGIEFDSALEMRFYRDVLLPMVDSGDVINYELQKKYELQPKFDVGGIKIRPIEYVADFYIKYKTGYEEVVDTKGCPDAVAKIKRKLFMYKYPEITYRWIVYVAKYGGWIDYDKVEKLRRETKKRKKMEETENG